MHAARCARAASKESTKEAATDGRPFLGICIGMQMLFDGSDESPDVAGLGVVAGRVTKLPDRERLPQMGWNTLERQARQPAVRRICRTRPGCTSCTRSRPSPPIATSSRRGATTGAAFAAAIETGPLWATQFHPEKSGAVGLRLLRNFVDAGGATTAGAG